MKFILITLLATLILVPAAFGHGEVKLGPNKGRLLSFGGDPKLSAEVREVDGKFQVELFDAKLQPVALSDQELTATSGERSKATKLSVEIKDGRYFILPTVKSGQFVIFQLKSAPGAKPFTARFKYDTTPASDATPEWLHAH
jgi:hypothetical protein